MVQADREKGPVDKQKSIIWLSAISRYRDSKQ
jgi:hypothetical protein